MLGHALSRMLMLAVGALVLAAPATAGAAASCPEGFRCTAVTVPLDRSGVVPGTLSLPVAVQTGSGPVVLSLTGGPGQGGVAFAPSAAQLFNPAAPGWRVVTFDQRGTGAGALVCAGLQAADVSDFTVPPPGTVESCASSLGALRTHFTTTDTVADMEAVRASLGIATWAVTGVSYGTYVAERYARAHPDRVSRLVLDSVVPQTNVNPLFPDNLAGAGTVLRDVCARGACRGITADAAADLAAVVRAADRAPLGGEIDGPALFDTTATLTSFHPRLLARWPAALHSARHGDPASVIRIVRVVRRANAATPAELSWGLHTATICGDVPFPWAGDSDPVTRGAALDAAVAALPAARLAPFDRATAAGNGLMDTCRRWPAQSVTPAPPPGALPVVPTLLLTGTYDLSTPSADARAELGRAPRGTLVSIPRGGHSVLTSATCATTALRRWWADREIGSPCRGGQPRIAPRPAPPRSVQAIRPHGLPGTAGRALAVVLGSQADALDLITVLFRGSATHVEGLRGGRATTVGPTGATLRFASYALVPGVRVTGRLSGTRGDLEVRGGLRARVRIFTANKRVLARVTAGGHTRTTRISGP